MIHPLIIKESSIRLCITGDLYKKLMKKPKAILWCRDGMYGILPIEAVKNAILLRNEGNDYRKSMGWVSRVGFIFNWNETVEIPVSTGQVLEKYNGKDNN